VFEREGRGRALWLVKRAAGLFRVALLSASLSFSSVGRAEEPVSDVVTVDVSAAGVDPARMRDAVGRELTRSAVPPEDPRAGAEKLTIAADPRAKTLTVSFRSSGRVVTRTVPLPVSASAIESAAVILAGNLARDQAGEILAARRRPAPSADASASASGNVTRSDAMKEQVAAYERGAKSYRDTLTDIVRLHYAAKKHAVLSDLDRELALEKAQLAKARRVAAQRLEEFLSAHAGEPGTEVPDAMARLAALEDERATADGDESARLHAIRLYERILREYPTYRGTAAAYYYLGHALADAGRVPEAQQVWRALVCHDRYAYPVLADRDVVHPLPANPGSTYVDPFPADCRPVTSPSPEGSRYVAEVWWQIGNWEFDQLDDAAGPWGYHRAASAYARALEVAKPPIYGVTLYKYAWTLFKQQRYEAATKAFVDLLRYTDEEEQRTGSPSADFREEAATYIAASLTSLAPTRLETAIDRLTDPTVVPQDRAWTLDVYRAVALELRGLDAFALAARVGEAMLQRWPLAPSAPATENAIAETFDELASISKDATAATASALDARMKLARYTRSQGETPWVRANADRPEVLREAERLARAGLRRAAAQRTNLARSALDAGDLARAEAEYRQAAAAWTTWLGQEPSEDEDVYAARYWNADALHKVVRLKVRRHEEPTATEIEAATLAAMLVRDSREDDRYVDNAAYFLVDLADVGRRAERREEVPFDGPDPRTRSVVRLEIPEPVARSMRARDAYAEVVSPDRDVLKRAVGYRYWVAETQFLYGHWAEARPRFEAIWKEQCGVDAYGFKAWEKLLTMATKARDGARALALLDAVEPRKGGRSCDAAAESLHAEPIRLELALEKAAASLDYAGTAEAEAKVATSAAFDEPRRREAAKSAVALYAALGDREHAREMRRTLAGLHPTERDLAEADARTLSPEAFYRDYHDYHPRPLAADLVLDAAYAAAREKRDSGEAAATSWLARTVAAWDELRKQGKQGKQGGADHAAEAAFTLLDEEISSTSDARGHAYRFGVARVFEEFAKDAAEATRWDLRLEREVVRKYPSPTWVVAALARQGSLFDALRSGLYDTTSPKLFDAAGARLLSGLRRAGQGDRADALEDAARDAWRTRKQTELDGADEVMVRRYAAAVAVAHAYGVTSPAVTRAAARLAYYTDIVGDAKLGSWVVKVPDPTDPTGQTKLTYRERMYDQTRPGYPAPARDGSK
jgi:hypothetical protein